MIVHDSIALCAFCLVIHLSVYLNCKFWWKNAEKLNNDSHERFRISSYMWNSGQNFSSFFKFKTDSIYLQKWRGVDKRAMYCISFSVMIKIQNDRKFGILIITYLNRFT